MMIYDKLCCRNGCYGQMYNWCYMISSYVMKRSHIINFKIKIHIKFNVHIQIICVEKSRKLICKYMYKYEQIKEICHKYCLLCYKFDP